MFDADRPITRSDQDRLNRTTFAKYLARCMLDHQATDSLVIGLEGASGVGKTSLINLTLEELHFAASNLLDEDKPIILNFSAWSYSGQHQLIYHFFRRLSSTLRNAPDLKNGEQIIYLLELYISFFTNQPTPKPYQTKRSWFNFKKRSDAYAWESGRDLTTVKAELNELLGQLNRKIIIVIDNISRLYDAEIKQILQIVKSMGDYTNTIYLLSFERNQVIHALDKLDVNGKSLINKIVQLPFTVPPILQQDLENLLGDRLENILKDIPQDAWNSEYWADIYYSSLKYFFTSCRDITRYVNILNFSYARVRDIVNPVDYFTLTAIEIFSPGVYEGIRDNKDLFSDLLDDVYALDAREAKEEQKRCDEILARTQHISKEIMLDLLFKLFPRIRRIYQPEVKFYYSKDDAIKQKRICSADSFDVYFRLSMQPTKISKAEFETILLTASDKNSFDQALMRLNQDGRISIFLSQLDNNILDKMNENLVSSIIHALLDNGDLFPNGISGPLSLDTPMRIHRIIHTLLQHLHDKEKHFLILQRAIASAQKSIYIIVHELQEQAREHSEEESTFLPPEFRDLTSEELVSLQQLTVTKIKAWAERNELMNYPFLFPILLAWHDWGNPEECRAFIEKLSETDRGLLSFLTAALEKPINQAMTRYEKSSDWDAALAEITLLISPKTLEPHAKLLFEDLYFDKLSEREQLALMIFLDLIKADTNKVIPQTSP